MSPDCPDVPNFKVCVFTKLMTIIFYVRVNEYENFAHPFDINIALPILQKLSICSTSFSYMMSICWRKFSI